MLFNKKPEPTPTQIKGVADMSIDIKKMTSTYTCSNCKIEYKFDPNDARKCDRVYPHGGPWDVNPCKRCHHFEIVVMKPCEKCGVELDPRYKRNEYHLVECVANICCDCGKGTHENGYSRATGASYVNKTGLRIIKDGDVYRCTNCFKDNALINVLTKLLGVLSDGKHA